MDGQCLDKRNCSSLDSDASDTPRKSFPFFGLPPELRVKIYSLILFAPNPECLSHSDKQHEIFGLQRTNIFLACKRTHAEAAYQLYSSQPFPLQKYSVLPAVADISLQYKGFVRSIQLALGSCWTKPPRSWGDDAQLGLHHMSGVHTLDIFVECDPSHPVFEGFRVSKEFYTVYAGRLVRDILVALPGLRWVRLDGNPSVKKAGDLMTRLISEVSESGKKILWGPKRGWRD